MLDFSSSLPLRKICLTVFAMQLLIVSATDSLACACCTHRGDRTVMTVDLDAYRQDILSQFEFATKAELLTGPRDLEDINGITTKSAALNIQLQRQAKTWVFSLDDGQGNTGTLKFGLPKRVSLFEVDPREPGQTKTPGLGPSLYKEWKLTSQAQGTGMISGSSGRGQKATLIFHGQGNHCASTADFNAWTLVLWGAKSEVTIFGDLRSK